MKRNKIIYIIGLLLILTACNDYLDQIPDNRTELNNVETIKELLTTAYPLASYYGFCEVMSDNAGDKGPSTSANRKFTDTYFWKNVLLTDQDTPTYYWNECYTAIAATNHALEALAILDVSEEQKTEVIGEALICRAYAHFMLANLFCKPYDPAILEASLGIPYVKEPEKVLLKNYKRGTLKETYDKIREDLEAGLKLVGNDYEVPRYHFTITSAAAFASRFYLLIGEWENAIKYANIALGANPETKLRDWTTQSYYSGAGYFEILDRYTSVDEAANLLLASTLSFWERNWVSRYSLTVTKRDEIFNAPGNFMGLNLKYRVFGGEFYANVPKIKEYFKKTSLNANTGWGYNMITLFSGDEVLLNRAEAYTMLNRKAEAAADIALFYSKKTDKSVAEISAMIAQNKIEQYYQNNTTVYKAFYDIPADVLSYVKCITDARRAEFIHEGMRWFDIRRFSLPVVHNQISDSGANDDLVLEPNDARKVLQIPVDAVSFGVEPNK